MDPSDEIYLIADELRSIADMVRPAIRPRVVRVTNLLQVVT